MVTLNRQFRTYGLQSFLAAVALALGTMVLTLVMATIYEQSKSFNNDFSQREITLQSLKNDWGAFLNSGEIVPVREVGLRGEEEVVLTFADLKGAEGLPSVDYAYVSEWQDLMYTSEGDTLSINAVAVTPDYQRATALSLSSGSLFSDTDFSQHHRAIVLSGIDMTRLGLTAEAVGQTIRLNNVTAMEVSDYTIMGVLDLNEASARSFIPYPFFLEETTELHQLHFAVKAKKDVKKARAELAAYAHDKWEQRVSVTSADNWLAEAQHRQANIVISALASAALAVAGFNTLNLMLGQVIKRRHDTGIQRALGATRNHILWQFLGWSLMLGCFGGILGCALGYGIFHLYLNYQISLSGYRNPSGFPVIVLPFCFSVALLSSLLLGFYPAFQASRLSPVEGLRNL